MNEITIPVWLLIVLIATNIVSIFVLVFLIGLICYIHDMIQVEIHCRKLGIKNEKNKKGERKHGRFIP